MRERQEGEFRAGPLIILVDQAISGFSGSSFDVAITDEREEDLKDYRMLFPALAKADIGISIIPSFDRARAQVWWDRNGQSDSVKAKVDTKNPNRPLEQLGARSGGGCCIFSGLAYP